MKHKAGYLILLNMLLWTLMLTGCPEEVEQAAGIPSTKGSFTLTEAGTINDKYAFVVCEITSGEEGKTFKLLGIKDTAAGNKKLVGVQVKNGTAKIPLYVYNGSLLQGYSGDDKEGRCTVYISDKKEMEDLSSDAVPTFLRYESVNFEKGTTTKKLSEADANRLQ